MIKIENFIREDLEKYLEFKNIYFTKLQIEKYVACILKLYNHGHSNTSIDFARSILQSIVDGETTKQSIEKRLKENIPSYDFLILSNILEILNITEDKFILELIIRKIKYQVLQPIYLDDSEFEVVDDDGLKQHKLCPYIFKDAGIFKKPYYLDAIYFENEDGTYFSGKIKTIDGKINSFMYIKTNPFIPYNFYVKIKHIGNDIYEIIDKEIYEEANKYYEKKI